MPALSDVTGFVHGQLFQQPFLPKTSFSGQTIVITGANTGLGLDCAKQVAALGASTIILGCRDLAKGEAAKKKINSAATIYVWQIDLTSFASVKAFAERVQTLPRLDAFVANAGVSDNHYFAAEGFERTLTVNVISTFLLSLLVLPQLQAQPRQTHLVIVGSNIHSFADHTQLQRPARGNVFASLSDEKTAEMNTRYFLSKLISMFCVRELASAASGNVIINTPSPGWCKTELFRVDDGGFMGRNMLKLIGRTSDVGARCLTSAIAAGSESHGQYLSECRVKPTSVFVRSKEGQSLQKAIWAELVDIMRGIDPDAVAVLQK